MGTETMQVAFSIEGAFMTRTARDVMLSDDPAKAWRLIGLSLVGDNADEAARGILDGTHRLEGVNEMTLVDDDPENEDTKRYLNPTMAHQRMAGELGLHLCRIGTTWEVRPGPGPRPR